MSGYSLEALILQLAAEFRERKMQSQLDALRAYYRAYRARKQLLAGDPRPPWTEETVIEWAMTFRLAPFESALPILTRGAPCPACRQITSAQKPPVYRSFPGGTVHYCTSCGTKWLVVDAAF